MQKAVRIVNPDVLQRIVDEIGDVGEILEPERVRAAMSAVLGAQLGDQVFQLR